jgi:hypothetical protein
MPKLNSKQANKESLPLLTRPKETIDLKRLFSNYFYSDVYRDKIKNRWA